MAENSKIEWCDHTFNPWEGCTKVGPGCDHCYAETRNKRFHGGNWGPGAPRRRTSPANWQKPIKWNQEAAEKGVRYRVFCASLADVFDNEVDPEWRAALFRHIHATPNLDWLLLTKRIGNAATMIDQAITDGHLRTAASRAWPWPNVWLGATIVNQEEADRDIPKLLQVPAAIRFLSMEPLLGPVNLNHVEFCRPCPIDCEFGVVDLTTGCFECSQCEDSGKTDDLGIDWVIVGGESGPGARPIHPEWARSIRDQCQWASVPFLFKQWGEWAPRAGELTGGGTDFQALDPGCKKWPDTIRLGEHGKDTRSLENCDEDAGEEIYVQRVGKKNAGRELDGRTWDELPEATP